jgi:uncharacterized protein (DUF1778 family)
MTQLHINIDVETKKMLDDTANYLKLNLSSFITSTCVREARAIMKNAN